MKGHKTYNRKLDAPLESTVPTISASVPNEEHYRQPPRSRRWTFISLRMALLLIGLVSLPACTFFSGNSSVSSSGSISLVDKTVQGNRIEMDVGNGDVDVRTGSDSGIHVQAVQTGGTAGDFTVDVSQSNDVVRVTQSPKDGISSFCTDCGVNYRVTAPDGVQMVIKTSSGDINLEGTNAAVELATDSGNVTARNLAQGIKANTSSSKIELHNVGGRLEATTDSGTINIDGGHLSDAVVKTSSGTFKYTGSLAHNGTSSIETVSGDVTLWLPRDSSFHLNASSTSGNVRSDFELNDRQDNDQFLNGTAGDGSAKLKIETSSGDISVERE